ncbi:MAG: 30S ribosomal protein S8 [Clostridiales bacterium]|nr:30S ribosomal protein S8 [Clostridiales bacterium]
MLTTAPIADMLTRIRNALVAKHEEVLIPLSNVKLAIAQILLDEGYIKDFKVREEGSIKNIVVKLKYANRMSVITGLKRISKPGLRVYARKDNVPKVLNGLGIAIISTSRGIMTDRQARSGAIGGEVLAYVW